MSKLKDTLAVVAGVGAGLIGSGIAGYNYLPELAARGASQEKIHDLEEKYGKKEQQVIAYLGKGSCEQVVYVTLTNADKLPGDQKDLKQAFDKSCPRAEKDHDVQSRIAFSYNPELEGLKEEIKDQKSMLDITGGDRLRGALYGTAALSWVMFGGAVVAAFYNSRRFRKSRNE